MAGTEEAQEIRCRIQESSDREVFIWGAGFWGNWLVKSFPDVNWKGYVDNHPHRETMNGFPVYEAMEFLAGYSGQVIVIATISYHREICQQLISAGIEEGRIIDAGKMMQNLFDDQYFDLPYLIHDDNETFVDAGCFDGATVRNFIRWCGGKYKEIISLEPDEKCFEACKTALSDVQNFTLEKCGLWSSEDVLRFHATGKSDSQINAEGEIQVKVRKLDDIVSGKKISFIKMDIEGAEKEAILGAEEVIGSQKPKMAVSVYHKKEDIWELPKLLLEMNPDYRFYLRHYSFRHAETVLYAI
ncbi:MAG: FkbM family methyltransferase [Lachnospiraceae bacterium]|nr:FkbM family methyltransferase [Lachnospiraceae bacterium]